MKFYYNGQLVRTSKTHEYHFAIINPRTGKAVSCHGTLEAAQKEHRRPIAECESSIARCRTAIKAIENGKTSVIFKYGRYSCKENLKGKDFFGRDRAMVSTWEEYIKDDYKRIEELRARKIVELEARA